MRVAGLVLLATLAFADGSRVFGQIVGLSASSLLFLIS